MDRVPRRDFLIAAGAFLAAPLAAEAQQAAKVARIGILAGGQAATPHALEAFLQGLRDLGYVEARNVVIEYRDAEGKPERIPALAAEQVAPGVSRVAVLWHQGGTEGRTEKDMLKAAEVAARALGVQLQLVETQGPADFERAFSEMTKARARVL